ncbi:MAG: transposase [Thalassospira sp.]|uniref:transposase n=1 Tax=Thalassospira sp. TaxID=1912094 RepID=UPI003A8C5CEA
MSKRKFYSQEFKQEAVSLVVDQGYTCAEAGRSLGVRGSLVGRWKRELELGDSAFQGSGQLTPDQRRIKELEAENRRLKMEKDVLKKATAFFVQEKP